MGAFDSGVKRFIRAYAVVEVAFPVSWRDNAEIACKHCPYYIRATMRCALNQAIVNYPETHVGSECPLEIIEETEGETENV